VSAVINRLGEEIAMKRITLFTLPLLELASAAYGKNAQANGTFDFGLGNATGAIVFDANLSDVGGVDGHMSFTSTFDAGDPEGEGSTESTTASFEADFDCLRVEENRAVMSGTITSSTRPDYIGQQVILAVVDKVDDLLPPQDAFSWGVYQEKYVNLTATDYDFCPEEDPESEFNPPCNEDTGASLIWTTADAELYPCPPPSEEDPYPSCLPDPNGSTAGVSVTSTVTSCDSFPLTAYPLNLIDGNKVQIKHHD